MTNEIKIQKPAQHVVDLTKGWAEVGVEPRPFMKEVYGIDHTVEAWPYMKSVARPIYGPPNLSPCSWEITARIRWSIDPQNINVGTGTDDVLVYELQINDGIKIVNPRMQHKMEQGENSSSQVFESREELEAAYEAAVAAKKDEIAAK